MNKIYLKYKKIIHWTIAILIAIVFVFYFTNYFVDIDIATLPNGNSKVIIVDKLNYGAINSISYARAFHIGNINRGDKVVASVNKQSLVCRIVAIAGDSVSCADYCIMIHNNHDYCESNSAKATFHLSPNNSYRVIHELERVTKQPITDTTEYIVLPINERKNRFATNTYSETPKNYSDLTVFPYSHNYKWNRCFWGPIYLPRNGETIELNINNAQLYYQLISKYENPEIKLIDNILYENGVELTSYSFKNNYYWLMNDDRDCVYDSRLFGPLPEYLIIGKTL